MMNFNILRDMESFTEKMFNGIIGFQEKDHPAWKSELSFDERIKNIPLHYLIFSNADRNPETHGPTVAHYYPLQYEMVTLASYIKQLGQNLLIYDAHARNGFIGSLLARECGRVIGLRDKNEKPNQIENLYDTSVYEMREEQLANVDKADVIFSSWMPSNTDITNDIIRINPKLVIFIFTEHVNEHNKLRQTGSNQSFGETLPKRYQLIDEWQVTRQENLLKNIWPDLTANIEETRIVRVYANEGYHQLQPTVNESDVAGYDWEQELLMAETALEAQRQMARQGFPIQ